MRFQIIFLPVQLTFVLLPGSKISKVEVSEYLKKNGRFSAEKPTVFFIFIDR
jgi:hypothetical protein